MRKLLLVMIISLFALCAIQDNQQDCFALARAYVYSCVELGGDDALCTQQAHSIYCACMKERGEVNPQGCQDE